MRRLDRLHLQFPFAGARMLRGLLTAEGCKIGPARENVDEADWGRGTLSPSANDEA